MRSSSSAPLNSNTPTSPNAARRVSPPHADDADSHSASHSDTEGSAKPSLNARIETTPSLPELVPPRTHAQLLNDTTALATILLRVRNSEANQIGKRLADISKRSQRDGVNAKSVQEIQDLCLMLSGLVWGRDGLGMGDIEHRQFEALVDKVFNESNRPEATQGNDSFVTIKEKSDPESPSKERAKRKNRSGEVPGSPGADKKRSKKNDIEISTPILTSPYPPKAATRIITTGNPAATPTTTANTASTATTSSTSMGASTSHSTSTDSPPLSPRRGFGILAAASATQSTGASASLLGRIATNLSTFVSQFETLVGFGHAIDRSKWSAIQDAQQIVKSLLESEGQPVSQLAHSNDLDKLSRAVTALNKALRAAEDGAGEVNHRNFDKAAFQKHARRMNKLLESIQSKVADLQLSTGRPMSPRSAPDAGPADAVGGVRSSSGGAKAHPSLATFGRKGGKSILQGVNGTALMTPQADAPNSPRSPRRSMLISAPIVNLKSNNQDTATTATAKSVPASSSPPPAPAEFALPLVSPLAVPTSPRPILGAQKPPQRLRVPPGASASGESIANLKAALGKYSKRDLMQGFAFEGNNVVPTGPASPADLRSLLSGPSARNLLQRFRIEGGNVVENDDGQPVAATSMPTQASGELSDADIAELLKKVEEGDADLIGRMIDSLDDAMQIEDDVPQSSLDDTVILTSSSDESESVHDNDGTTDA
ncbi:MAG: hypothetical protein JWR21_3098 [Herminiimonas sp.]|nr:hypothetical protein [Herminiimonas sp.]